jgi:23S rRNA (adenine2030-N6)-methyltransferase
MNYRHAFHAGNFADVLKHAVLALVIEHLKLKPAPFRVIDTHAGVGRYDLSGVEADKTGEWRDGIGRLIGPGSESIPPDVADILAPYLGAVRALSADGEHLRWYPGSPTIARHLLRRGDSLVVTELHPADYDALAAEFVRDGQVKVLQLDGWLALKSMLPPPERRGVVLVDPPFEARDEFERLARGLKEALARFRSGAYVLWYPLKDRAAAARLHAAVAALQPDRAVAIELWVRDPEAPGLGATGLVVVNAPWTLGAKLDVLLPFLAHRLAQSSGSGWRVVPLASE